jgi:membrane-bound ClpP family serine protease
MRTDERKAMGRGLAALVLACLLPRPLCAEELQVAGLVVPISTTITSQDTQRLKTLLDSYGPFRDYKAARQRDAKLKFRLVCDFNPGGRKSDTADFGSCYDLYKYLRSLRDQNVETIAFIHGEVIHHSVLPVLACSEVVLSRQPRAEIGRVAAPGSPLADTERDVYKRAAEHRYPLVLIKKMFDPNVEVLRAPQGHKGEAYVDGNDRPRPEGMPEPDLGIGDTALYSFDLAQRVGLFRPEPCNSVEDVVRAYNLPHTALFPPLEEIVARRINVAGAMSGELRETVERQVKRALDDRANLLIFNLACADKDPEAAYDLGRYLASLNDNRQGPHVLTVAFVTREAQSTAAFVAFGCNKIVLQRDTKDGDTIVRAGGRLGEFDNILKERPNKEPELKQRLAEIARKQHYPEDVAQALVGRADEHPLLITPERARERGIATDAADFEEVCRLEGVDPAKVPVMGTDWLNDLVNFLVNPYTRVVLVMLGITCLILELKMPGVVAPGCISAICFVLFFWSHSQHTQILWLAILLFVLGLLLIALEVFVLPGFGFAGVSGIILVISSLGLVAYGHWPHSQEQWGELAQHIGPFGLSILGALVCAFLLARYLPSIPYANRLILQPQGTAEDGSDAPEDPAHAELAALLGAIGVAATPLRPAGKAQFGDAFVDVVAEGTYVLPGSRVQVIEIEGNRVVVKEV